CRAMVTGAFASANPIAHAAAQSASFSLRVGIARTDSLALRVGTKLLPIALLLAGHFPVDGFQKLLGCPIFCRRAIDTVVLERRTRSLDLLHCHPLPGHLL